MATFLSNEWIRELALACEGAAPAPNAERGRFVLEPVVTGVPDRGEVRYWIAFTAGACAVEMPPLDESVNDAADASADVRLETDYVTAVALSRGTANAQLALADGRLRVSGDVAALAGHASVLAALDDLFAAVRSETTYPPPS